MSSASSRRNWHPLVLGALLSCLALLYAAVYALDAPHQAFVLGSWITSASARADRFRALYSAHIKLLTTWDPVARPFVRNLYDGPHVLALTAVDDGEPAAVGKRDGAGPARGTAVHGKDDAGDEFRGRGAEIDRRPHQHAEFHHVTRVRQREVAAHPKGRERGYRARGPACSFIPEERRQRQGRSEVGIVEQRREAPQFRDPVGASDGQPGRFQPAQPAARRRDQERRQRLAASRW